MTQWELIKNMQNVKHGECDAFGKRWTTALNSEGKKRMGTSADGLWIWLTDGKENVFVRKSNVLKYDAKKAIALFN